MTDQKKWVTRHKIVRDQLMLGKFGLPIRHRLTVQRMMEKLPSYCQRPTEKNQIAHYVLLSDIEAANKEIKARIAKSKKR